MPHVDIKHFPKELSDEDRDRLAEALTAVVAEHFGTHRGAVSIALEAVAPEEWTERVVTTAIEAHPHRLIKAPDYRA
ncbi:MULTISPECIES: tautomerase PptA [Streptomyces]|uniref:tautomerase PptA n=1 Tax=Streptomyces TaxID=1883 RepID=UPI0022492C8A|nr:tautomerase PptA [Streptomyces sp. JHD 1]MCX2968864.1 tautomerase PptA [Streptomyces sp. JHD 1]